MLSLNMTSFRRLKLKYISYHGTNKQNANKILSVNFSIKLPVMMNNLYNPHNHEKVPGSLGFGLYTFIDNPSLAKDFSIRFNHTNWTVVEIQTEINHNELLDLDNSHNQTNYHEFKNKVRQQIELVAQHNYQRAVSSRKQSVLDGITIELYIMAIKKQQISINAVKMKTYTTTLKTNWVSIVPNGIELCIRNINLIQTKRQHLPVKGD